MNHTHGWPRPFSWPLLSAFIVEALVACGFVIAVYELVVAGAIALFPAASPGWVLVFWVAATSIAGSGMTAVRSHARALMHKVLPTSDPYGALMSSVSGAAATGPAEGALPRLAELLAEGTGARGAAVWISGPSGLWRASSWPEDGAGRGRPDGAGPKTPPFAASEADLRDRADVDYVAPVRDGGQVLGALTLLVREGRDVALPDVRLATDMANAAGLLLRNAELAERLREQLRVQTAQAAELAASRRRLVVARDAAREQLGAEIQDEVCKPLERSAKRVALLSPEGDAAGAPLMAGLAEMSGEIDMAIADFRRIVHGVYPAVLTDLGLQAALESLIAELDLRATLVSPRIPRLDTRVEAGTYFCAAALLRAWDGSGTQHPMQVIVEVTSYLIRMRFMDGVTRSAMPVSPLVAEAARDRVAAMGGRMDFGSGESGRWVAIEAPLNTTGPAEQDGK